MSFVGLMAVYPHPVSWTVGCSLRGSPDHQAGAGGRGEAGCNVPQIAAITGHTQKGATAILDRYLARTRVLPGEAVALFENAPSTQFANRLQTGTPHKPKEGAK